MTKLRLDISTSLDGSVAGPNPTLERPLGDGGERLHEWAFKLASFRERHGLEGGETNVDGDVVDETLPVFVLSDASATRATTPAPPRR